MKKTTNKTKTVAADKEVRLYEGKAGKKPTKKDKLVSVIGLASPVTEMAVKIATLFRFIPGMYSDFEDETGTLYVYTGSDERAEALRFFLRGKYEFGNLKLRVRLFSAWHGQLEEESVPPAYTVTDEARVRMFMELFKGGPLEPAYRQVVDQTGTPWDFFEFPAYGLSFDADDLQNLRGRKTALVADLVKEVFDTGSFKISSMG